MVQDNPGPGRLPRCPLHRSLVTVCETPETTRNPFILCMAVLDSSIGKPAPGVGVHLKVRKASAIPGDSETWSSLAKG